MECDSVKENETPQCFTQVAGVKIPLQASIIGKDVDTATEEQQDSKILAELYDVAKGLPQQEQEYALDRMKTFQNRRETITDGREE